MNANDFVIYLLRSRLHRLLSGNTLLITVRGRKSGREITLPVNYVHIGSELWVLSSRERSWWRNVQGGAPVSLRLCGEDVPAWAEAVLDEAEVAERLGAYLRRIPMAARSLEVKMANGAPNGDDLLRVAKERLMVRLQTDIDKSAK